MKKIILSLLICQLVCPVFSQIRPKNINPARAGRITLPRMEVSQLSRKINLQFERSLYNIQQHKIVFPRTHLRRGHPTSSTFQVQFSNELNRETASAFAIRLRGKVWGVTAAHVLKNILPHPYVKIETSPNVFTLAPIQKFFKGKENANAMDVALFEMPQEALPFVKVLEPAQEAPAAGMDLNIPGFTVGEPVFAPQQKVLFATSFKLLLQKTMPESLRGFCGSPLLDAQHKVRAIYIGFVETHQFPHIRWLESLPDGVSAEMPAFHLAIPVQVLEILAKGAEKGSLEQTGKMMYVFDHPVAMLHPNEYILSVEQFRAGEKIGKVSLNPLVDPAHLEHFFELEENDTLRVVLRHPQTAQAPSPYTGYDINVSTGEVVTLTEKQILGF